MTEIKRRGRPPGIPNPGTGRPKGIPNPNAGRNVRWIELSSEDAKTVKTLLSVRGSKATKEAIERYISGLIREQWAAYDAHIQAIAEFEGII